VAVSTAGGARVWERGRLDARQGARQILFGRMYEDAAIEVAAFRERSRIFCIASAGCTAGALAERHEVVAVDINPVQLAYAQARLAGRPAERGAAERFMSMGRHFAPLVGWSPERVRSFLDLADPAEQVLYWRQHLDTRRFRTAVDGLMSLTALRAFYAEDLLDFLPARLGSVMRGRMARCFSRHPNRTNPYARALLVGDLPPASVPRSAAKLRLVHADAASFLEAQPPGSFDGFALSNILDGSDVAYRGRLAAAVLRAASPDAVVVRRSFREPPPDCPDNHAADDRSMLWGLVEVVPAAKPI
jgi:S-adenosylmethionine:diacylglycerol 3-amino-3-carboxypropyl transferase